jgi:hypothetical protein
MQTWIHISHVTQSIPPLSEFKGAPYKDGAKFIDFA